MMHRCRPPCFPTASIPPHFSHPLASQPRTYLRAADAGQRAVRRDDRARDVAAAAPQQREPRRVVELVPAAGRAAGAREEGGVGGDLWRRCCCSSFVVAAAAAIISIAAVSFLTAAAATAAAAAVALAHLITLTLQIARARACAAGNAAAAAAAATLRPPPQALPLPLARVRLLVLGDRARQRIDLAAEPPLLGRQLGVRLGLRAARARDGRLGRVDRRRERGDAARGAAAASAGAVAGTAADAGVRRRVVTPGRSSGGGSGEPQLLPHTAHVRARVAHAVGQPLLQARARGAVGVGLVPDAARHAAEAAAAAATCAAIAQLAQLRLCGGLLQAQALEALGQPLVVVLLLLVVLVLRDGRFWRLDERRAARDSCRAGCAAAAAAGAVTVAGAALAVAAALVRASRWPCVRVHEGFLAALEVGRCLNINGCCGRAAVRNAIAAATACCEQRR